MQLSRVRRGLAAQAGVGGGFEALALKLALAAHDGVAEGPAGRSRWSRGSPPSPPTCRRLASTCGFQRQEKLSPLAT
jgi:hypothetical protein